VCQTITRDIGAGTMSYRCGPPTHLGLGARLDLLAPARLRRVAGAAGESTYGMRGPQPGDDTQPEYITVQRVVTGETTVALKKMKIRGTDEGPYTGTEVRAMVQNGALAPSAITITTADPITPDP
jgi:hypothetical protein